MNSKKRILISIDWFVPGYKAGGPIQSCANLIAHLKEEFDFWVITRNTDYCSDEPYNDVLSDSWNALEKNVHAYYFSQKKLNSTNLYKVIRDVNADIVYINGVYSFYFSVLPIFFSKALRVRQILIAGRGMFAPGSINVKGEKKRLFFRIVKALGLYKNVAFHATNKVEQDDIRAILGDQMDIKIAPNLPKVLSTILPAARHKEVGKLKVISVARISPEKNTKFALEVLSNYRGTGKILFDIYGPVYNSDYWEECQKVMSQLPLNVTVTYHGSLENSLIHEKLSQYHLMFLPTRGENFGHIILESLMAGCPVLISDKTPWKNLQDFEAGFDLQLDDQQSFIDVLANFVHLDAEHFNQFSVNAIGLAKKYIEDKGALDANRSLFAFS